MGKFVGSALAGVVGSALFFGCGAGTTGSIEEAATFEADGATSGIDPTGSAKSAWAGEDAGGVDDGGSFVLDAAIGEDAAVDSAVPFDASVGQDSGPPTLILPARLSIDSVAGTACWSEGAAIGQECKPVPAIAPPIIRMNDQCGTPTAWPIVHVRVPPGTCAKITGQWSGACVVNPSEPSTRCATVTNTKNVDIESGRLYKKIVIEWQSGTACSCPD